MDKLQREDGSRSNILRIFICLVILGLGAGGFLALKSMKKPPTRIPREEQALNVQVITAARKDVAVTLTGYGELKSMRSLALAVEVAGKVVAKHPNLEKGAVIDKGELLIAVDDADFRTDYLGSKERLAITRRDLALAEKELGRVKSLFKKNRVGSQVGVEKAAQAVNNAAARAAQLRQAMNRAKNKLDRCRLVAPFTGRIISENVEVGEYVTPGKTIAVLSDDATLEVEVPIYGYDAVSWLDFKAGKQNGHWFTSVEPVVCTIRWTDSPKFVFTGDLQRVTSFSRATRSLNVVVQLGDRRRGKDGANPFPLVSGMFVSVDIPGRTMFGIFELPRTAVSFDNNVFVVRNDRLYTVPVQVVRIQGEYCYVKSGIKTGDKVIITRLIDPVEGSLIRIVPLKEGASL